MSVGSDEGRENRVRIREATADDVEAVVDVACDSWYAAYGGFLDPATIEQAVGEYYDPELVEGAVGHDEIAFYVAEDPGGAGDVVGTEGDNEGSDDGGEAGVEGDDGGGDGAGGDDGGEAGVEGDDGGGDDGGHDGEGSDGGTEAVIGFASAEQTWADEVELHTIYVHPGRWGEGVGTALLDRVKEWARERGVDRISLGVLQENAVGVGFFEGRGFQRGAEGDAEITGELHPEIEFELEL